MTADELNTIKYAFNEALKPFREEMNARVDHLEERLDNVEKRLGKIERDVKTVKSDIKTLKNDSTVNRTVTNDIVEWIDVYFRKDRPFPVG